MDLLYFTISIEKPLPSSFILVISQMAHFRRTTVKLTKMMFTKFISSMPSVFEETV